MSAFSNFVENELIKHLFRTGSFTKPTALYIALFTAAPSDAGGGTEVSGAGYARVNLAPSDSNWAAPTDGSTSNAVNIAFGLPTADWGVVTHLGVFDAVTGGNLLLWGALTAQKTVNNGDSAPVFNSGDLVFSVT